MIVSVIQDTTQDQKLLRPLGCQIKASHQAYLRKQLETSGMDIKSVLDSNPPLVKEAWTRIKEWCQEENNCAPPPAWITIERITEERAALYQRIDPPLGRTSLCQWNLYRCINRYHMRQRQIGPWSGSDTTATYPLGYASRSPVVLA